MLLLLLLLGLPEEVVVFILHPRVVSRLSRRVRKANNRSSRVLCLIIKLLEVILPWLWRLAVQLYLLIITTGHKIAVFNLQLLITTAGHKIAALGL